MVPQGLAAAGPRPGQRGARCCGPQGTWGIGLGYSVYMHLHVCFCKDWPLLGLNQVSAVRAVVACRPPATCSQASCCDVITW